MNGVRYVTNSPMAFLMLLDEGIDPDIWEDVPEAAIVIQGMVNDYVAKKNHGVLY